MIEIDWRKIRVHKTSQRLAFEELVCQLAYGEKISNRMEFIRVEAPDGGIEAYWVLENGDEIGWQAKYHIDGMGLSQWKQIEKSFEKALDTHLSLKEYYICLPIDFADPRIPERKSLQDKWDGYIKKWTDYALSKGRAIKFRFWGSFQLTERLTKNENSGRRYYWFSETEFSGDWFNRLLNESIKNLGSRYTPKLNVELDISKLFDGIYRSTDYKEEFVRLYHNFLIEASTVIQRLPEAEFSDYKTALSKKTDEIKILFSQISYDEIKQIDAQAWLFNLAGIIALNSNTIKQMDDLDKLDKEMKIEKGLIKDDDVFYRYYYHLFSHEKSQVRDFNKSANKIHGFIAGDSTGGFNIPFLLLKGERGIGKSHLLADIALNKIKKGNPSLLLLGQHFNGDDPWVQILSKLGIRETKEGLLGALDAKGQSQQCRVLIIIDAINEGAGIQLWPNHIRGFIHTIKRYKWIGLILSIRTPYEELIFDKEFIEENLIEIFHDGFNENEYEASKFFFKEYGIEQPKIPLLYPEFRQPLFLKLFCEGLQKAGQSSIPNEGYEGISEIMDFLIKATNISLSKQDRLKFSPSLPIVNIAVETFIRKLIDSGQSAISYPEAHLLLEQQFLPYKLNSGILEELVVEGLLSKTLFRDKGKLEEGVYFTYQRYEDHFRAKHLLSAYFDIAKPKKAFSKTGGIGKLFKDDHTAFVNIKLLEALAIQVPEITGFELFEMFPHIKRYNFFIRAVIGSLHWRKSETINGKLFNYLRPFLNEDFFKLLLDTILLISGKPRHYFNADFVHRFLFPLSMAERDTYWTTYINKQYNYSNAVKRLIDWCWSDDDKSHIDNESVFLVAVSVSWFLTASNRNLRDGATKALVSVLRNRIALCVELLKKFKDVNDPGVYERLFAVAYGVSLTSEDKKDLEKLAQYIYGEIFDKQYVVSHILLRDYARNTIEFALQIGCNLDIKKEKITPPYKSEWYRTIPGIREIKKYEFDYKAKDFKEYYRSQNAIIDSVFGKTDDFDKDVLMSIRRMWKIQLDEVQRLVIKRVFELGYDVERHGEYDRHLSDYRFDDNKVDTIGRKYQWLAFYEVAAKVSDHKPPAEKHAETYNGPWEPYIRDIDPSLLITKTHAQQYQPITKNWWFRTEYDNWGLDNKTWVHQVCDLPDSPNLLNITNHNGHEWLVLNVDVSWESPVPIGAEKYDVPRKDLRYDIEAYLVKKEEQEELVKYLLGEGRKQVKPRNRNSVYEMFCREYYWSPAYNDLISGQPYYTGFPLEHAKSGNKIADCIYMSNYFTWEEQFDYSKEETIRFIKPSKILFEGMKLQYTKNEGEYKNNNNELVCLDPSVNHPGNSCLLVRKIEFLRFLEADQLSVIWMMRGEKRLLDNYRHNENKYWGHNYLSGLYYLNDNIITGKLSSRIEEKT